MSDEDWKQTHPLGSTWRFSWTEDYVVTVTGHTRRGLKVSYKKPGTGHTLKRGIYQPEELVPEKWRGRRSGGPATGLRGRGAAGGGGGGAPDP